MRGAVKLALGALGVGGAAGGVAYWRRWWPFSALSSGSASSGGKATQPKGAKYKIDASKLPGPGPAGPARQTRAYYAWAQNALNKIAGASLTADGIWGSNSRSACRVFQSDCPPLRVDGYVGPQTEAALIQLGASSPPGIV